MPTTRSTLTFGGLPICEPIATTVGHPPRALSVGLDKAPNARIFFDEICACVMSARWLPLKSQLRTRVLNDLDARPLGRGQVRQHARRTSSSWSRPAPSARRCVAGPASRGEGPELA